MFGGVYRFGSSPWYPFTDGGYARGKGYCCDELELARDDMRGVSTGEKYESWTPGECVELYRAGLVFNVSGGVIPCGGYLAGGACWAGLVYA